MGHGCDVSHSQPTFITSVNIRLEQSCLVRSPQHTKYTLTLTSKNSRLTSAVQTGIYTAPTYCVISHMTVTMSKVTLGSNQRYCERGDFEKPVVGCMPEIGTSSLCHTDNYTLFLVIIADYCSSAFAVRSLTFLNNSQFFSILQKD